MVHEHNCTCVNRSYLRAIRCFLNHWTVRCNRGEATHTHSWRANANNVVLAFSRLGLDWTVRRLRTRYLYVFFCVDSTLFSTVMLSGDDYFRFPFDLVRLTRHVGGTRGRLVWRWPSDLKKYHFAYFYDMKWTLGFIVSSLYTRLHFYYLLTYTFAGPIEFAVS